MPVVPVRSIEELLAERAELVAALGEVGEFRRGSVSSRYRKCGKLNCACARRPGHRGHGPQVVWMRTAGGKSRGRQLAPEEVDKVRGEIFRSAEFFRIVDRLVEVNEAICEARPAGVVADVVARDTAGAPGAQKGGF